MDKFLLKIALIAFFLLTVTSYLTSPVFAANLNVDCAGGGSCSKTGLDPVFSNALDGKWYPSKNLTKTINLKNSSSDTRVLAIKGVRTSSVSTLENVFQVSVYPTGGLAIWAGSLSDFYSQDHIDIGNFNSGSNLNINLSVSMNASADNTYQDLQSIFDQTLGFYGGIVSGGGGGSVLGAGVSSADCSDGAPGSAPTLVSAISSGNNQVVLTWTGANNPVTYYLVTYGTSPGSQQYGNPNVGGVGATSYTVSGLSGGVTYYFKVRAGNGCTPGSFSNEVSATPGGGVIAGSALGFAPGVLGVATKEGAISDVKSASSESGKAIEGSFADSGPSWLTKLKPYLGWIGLSSLGVIGGYLFFHFFKGK